MHPGWEGKHRLSWRLPVCRPALPKDTPDVMALTARIWEGRDYVPRAWDAWLHDYDGYLAVVECGGYVLGLLHLEAMGAGEWWLEGLRVHPDYQGLGLATRLHDYVMAYWLAHGDGVLRLTTSSKRLPVHHLCERTGFERINTFQAQSAASLPLEGSAFHQLAPDEAPALFALCQANPLNTFTHGLLDLDWQWGQPTKSRLRNLIASGLAFGEWRARGELQAAVVLEPDEDVEGEFAAIRLLACAQAQLGVCLQVARQLAYHAGYQRVRWVAPDDQILMAALSAGGFNPDRDHALYLYQRTHPRNLEAGR